MTGQKERVLAYMEAHGSITQRQATDDLSVARLASRIDELRKAGHPIVTVRKDGVNKFGEKCHWAEYRMGGEGVNTRIRQKIKAELRRENPDVMATLKTVRLKDDIPVRQIIFVPRSEIRAYKARYGDRIEFWDEEHRNERSANHGY